MALYVPTRALLTLPSTVLTHLNALSCKALFPLVLNGICVISRHDTALKQGNPSVDNKVTENLTQEHRMSSITSLNIGKTMEKKLHSVDIHTAEELINIGSKEAIKRLKMAYPSTCVVILYHLEAAIEGLEMKLLSAERKAVLKEFFKTL
jgi:DNA transformation protein